MTVLVLAAIFLAVAGLILTQTGRDLAGAVDGDRLAGLAWGVGVLGLILAGSWRRILAAPGASARAMLAWVLIGLALVVGYSHRDALRGLGARTLGALSPGTAVPESGGRVAITRRADGSFRVSADVNGRTQDFLFDTGASSVVLTAENAAALGLHPPEDAFRIRVSTANGTAYAAPIQLDTLRVGTITERRVEAMVARPGALTGNLLGQTFLQRLSGYEVRGDRLILAPP